MDESGRAFSKSAIVTCAIGLVKLADICAHKRVLSLKAQSRTTLSRAVVCGVNHGTGHKDNEVEAIEDNSEYFCITSRFKTKEQYRLLDLQSVLTDVAVSETTNEEASDP